MKKVSVIIPVYNSQEYLIECVESLVNQTLEEIELIFVNDGSTDNSTDILKEYKEKYPEKIIVADKENGGQATARNMGISMATGEYIGFVDSDDYVDKNMYEVMYSKAKEADLDYVECGYKYLFVEDDGSYTTLNRYANARAYKDKKEMFLDPLVSPWNKLYRASILQDNSIRFPEGVIYEDTSFYIKAIPFLNKTTYLEEEFVYHFLRKSSTMNSKKDAKVANIFTVLEDFITYYREHNYYDEYRDELEFFTVKILLRSSLGRVAMVNDRKLRKKLEKDTLNFIKSYFKDYRSNPYMHSRKVGRYLRFVNGFTIGFIVMGMRMKGVN